MINKSSETLRMKIRDAIQEYIEKNLSFCDPVDTTCDIADLVFEVLGISEKEQDIPGVSVKIITNKKGKKICD